MPERTTPETGGGRGERGDAAAVASDARARLRILTDGGRRPLVHIFAGERGTGAGDADDAATERSADAAAVRVAMRDAPPTASEIAVARGMNYRIGLRAADAARGHEVDVPGRDAARGSMEIEKDGRLLADLDLRLATDDVARFIDRRRDDVTRVHRAIGALANALKEGGLLSDVPRTFPSELSGRLVNADGTPAAGVLVVANRPTFDVDDGKVPWTTPSATTDGRGAFRLAMPAVPVPDAGLRLTVQGAGRSTTADVRRIDLITGRIGLVRLDETLRPQGAALIDGAIDRVPAASGDAEDHPTDYTSPGYAIDLGEDDERISFGTNRGVIDVHRYSVLVRLVEPRLGNAMPVVIRPRGDAKYTLAGLKSTVDEFFGLFPDGVGADLAERLLSGSTVAFRDRVPIEGPIDVTGFQDQVEESPSDLPKASTLGLGYFVGMRQVWLPAGYSLGDLVYSLPLAPGEEQRIAVTESSAALSVRESETLTDEEVQRFDERSDASTESVFTSAALDMSMGGSMTTAWSTASGLGIAGGAAGVASAVLLGAGAAAGFGSSTSIGSSSTWQSASRNMVSTAAESFQSQLARQAAARRRAQRTGMRLATANEQEKATTRIIANYNHSHAMTVQYWEVLRHYAVDTEVDDVQLCCFVPMELVQWLPRGQSRELSATTPLNRSSFIRRYGMLLRHLEVVAESLGRHARRHRRAIGALRRFAADPQTAVQDPTDAPQLSIDFEARLTAMPFEDFEISVVLRDGRRVARSRLSSTIEPAAIAFDPLQFTSWAALEETLRTRRSGAFVKHYATLRLPTDVDPDDIARLELRRWFRPVSWTINPAGATPGGTGAASPIGAFVELVGGQAGIDVFEAARAAVTRTFQPPALEKLLPPLQVYDAIATIDVDGESVQVVHEWPDRGQRVEAVDVLRIPARTLPPRLRWEDVIRIEQLFQHVVRDGVRFSRAVWTSLTPDERALLLEPYTIGIPEDGSGSLADEIPLLNCVVNQVVAVYGNCLVMPFSVPAEVAKRTERTSAEIQDALLAFHRQSFRSPRSSITLPTRGVLAEAVLGTSNASEKVDITRFWNWKDSPHRAAGDASSLIDAQRLLDGSIAGPSKLADGTTLSAAIDALGKLDRPTRESLAKAMIGQAASFAPPDRDMTGIAQAVDLAKATTTAAQAAQKESVGGAVSMGSKVLDMYPQALDAAGKYDAAVRAPEREAAREQAEREERKRVAEQKAERKTNLLDFAGETQIGLDKVLEYFGARGVMASRDIADPAAAARAAETAALDEAKVWLGNKLGPDNPLNAVDRQRLYALYDTMTVDSYEDALSKWAIYSAAELPVPSTAPKKDDPDSWQF